MNNQPIGILDSGVGGLTIWKEIVSLLPYESMVYIADSANCPYGEKSATEILQFSRKMVQFLLDKDCKLIVIACNTISVSSLKALRKEFPRVDFIGTVPVVKTAGERSKNRRIGILSTSHTAESRYQQELIGKYRQDCEVINVGTDRLVPLVERSAEQTLNKTLTEVLQPFISARIDTLALGCSHFPLLKKEIQQVLGNQVTILDSSEAIARQVERVLKARNEFCGDSPLVYTFYTTGNILRFSEILKTMGYNENVEEVAFSV